MKKKLTKGVSWQSQELLDAGQANARQMGMSFSSYINHLVRRDLGIKGVFSQDAERELSVAAPVIASKSKRKKALPATGG